MGVHQWAPPVLGHTKNFKKRILLLDTQSHTRNLGIAPCLAQTYICPLQKRRRQKIENRSTQSAARAPFEPHPPKKIRHAKQHEKSKNQYKRGGVVCAIRAAARHKNLHGREYACPSADCKFSSREKKIIPAGSFFARGWRKLCEINVKIKMVRRAAKRGAAMPFLRARVPMIHFPGLGLSWATV